MPSGGEKDDRLEAMRASMRSLYRLLGERSPAGSVVERPGVLAAMVPSARNRSIVNAVVHDAADRLSEYYDEIAAAYRSAWERREPEVT